MSHIKAKTSFQSNLSHAWATVHQIETFSLFIPRLKKVSVLEKKGTTQTIRIDLNSPSVLPNFWNILYLNYDEIKHHVTWERREGNLKINEGTVTLTGDPENGRYTELLFDARLQAGAIIPQFLLEWAAKKFIATSLAKLSKQLSQTQPQLELLVK